MKFEIRSVKNGYILKAQYTMEEEESEEIVYQETYDGDEAEDVECFADFLRLIDEYYGPSTSKYSPKRVFVVVEPGHCYEPPSTK